MDYVKELAELREKINWAQNEPDIAKSELYHREIRNELGLKREQVLQLKKELNVTNSKNFELNRELETTKSLLKECEFNLKLALKKSAAVEDKMKDINESYFNLKLKEEMRLSELQILNENIQKMAQDNHQLSREVNELKDKLKYSYAFQDELEERQSRINIIIGRTKENTEKLEKEQVKVIELETKLQNAEKYQNVIQLLMQETEKIKKENTEMENVLTESSAKYEKLHDLIKSQKYADSHQQNIIGKIKNLQWESRCKKFEEKNASNEQIIGRLTFTLNQEIETNAQLVSQNEEYEARIEELEKKFNIVKLLKEETDTSVIEIE